MTNPTSNPAFEILEVLNKIRPRRPSSGRAGTELRAHRVSIYALLIAIALMGIMLAFAAWHNLATPLPGVAQDIARTFGAGSILAGMTAMISLVVESISSVAAMIKAMFRDFIAELEWDLDQASLLTRFDKKDLKQAQEFLELKANRSRERIKLAVGGPDKLALLTLLGAGWATYKEFPGMFSFIFGGWREPLDIVQAAGSFVIAFILGMVIGAIFMNIQLQRYTYQLEVLKLHLSSRE